MDAARDETSEKLEALTGSQIAQLQTLAKNDLFFLAKAVLGYDQVCPEAHGALCKFMVHESRNRRMVLMPRGHLKTTICTIADSIRLSLVDPNTRVLIQNEVFENASDMLTELKKHWETNQMLRTLFPELTPPRFSGPGTDWAKDSASIVRSRNSKESTYTASGSGGSPQSKHFEWIKNDDLIGEEHKESAAKMDRAIRWCDSMVPLLDSPTNQLDWYGTRKTMSDAYQHVIDSYGDGIAVFIREPIENGVPIFPRKWPMAELQRIMTNMPEMWAHDFMNNPIGKGGLDWGVGLLQKFAWGPNQESVRFVDNLSGLLLSWKVSELDIVITVDPNSGKISAPDKAAVIVHGVSPQGHVFVLEAWSDRVQPDGLIDKIWELASRWRPRVVGIEDAGQQNTSFYFEKRCMLERTIFPIRPLKHMNIDKERRIRTALDIQLKSRSLYVLPSQTTLIGQIQLFPQLAKHNWDEIDCLSYGPELYQNGKSLADLAEAEEAEEVILSSRGLTGYGSSV